MRKDGPTDQHSNPAFPANQKEWWAQHGGVYIVDEPVYDTAPFVEQAVNPPVSIPRSAWQRVRDALSIIAEVLYYHPQKEAGAATWEQEHTPAQQSTLSARKQQHRPKSAPESNGHRAKRRTHGTENLLTIQEAADRLGVHYQTIRNWIDSGKLPAFQRGQTVRIPADSLAVEEASR